MTKPVSWIKEVEKLLKKYPNGVMYKQLENDLRADIQAGNFSAKGDAENSLRAMIFHNGDISNRGYEDFKSFIGKIDVSPATPQENSIIKWK